MTKYIFCDLNHNGASFDSDFDTRSNAGLRIGARLAAQGLVFKSFTQIIRDRPVSEYVAFNAHDVLKRIVVNALQKSKDAETVVAVVLHLDEFQFYVDAFPDAAQGREALKLMLREVGDFMRQGLQGTEYYKRFFIVPVLTGTAATDVHFLITEKYKEFTILLGPITQASGFQMYDDKFIGGKPKLSEPELNDLSEEEGKGRQRLVLARSQNHFHVAMADTGFLPRILDDLLNLEADEIEADTNWGYVLSTYENRKRALTLEAFGGMESAEALIHFSLSAQLVEREFSLPGGTKVGDLERMGELVLKPSEDNTQFYVFISLINRVLSLT